MNVSPKLALGNHPSSITFGKNKSLPLNEPDSKGIGLIAAANTAVVSIPMIAGEAMVSNQANTLISVGTLGLAMGLGIWGLLRVVSRRIQNISTQDL